MHPKSANLPDGITETYQGKTILISGASGFIGSALTKSLLEIDCRLLLLDHGSTFSWIPQDRQAEVAFIQADVSLKHTWESALPGVDVLFHLAALEYNRVEFNIMQDLQTNAISVIHLLEVCRQNDLRPRIIFSSSANLFGQVNSLPVNESQQSHPTTLWSVHKLLAENYLNVYAIKYDINSIILRLANVYGVTENRMTMNNVVINNVITMALRGENLTLYKNYNCIRDFIFIKDVIMAFLHAGANYHELSGQNYFVIGSGEGKTFADIWRLIAKKIHEVKGREIQIVYDDTKNVEPFDMRNFIADSALFQKITGWQPSTYLDEGLTLTINELI